MSASQLSKPQIDKQRLRELSQPKQVHSIDSSMIIEEPRGESVVDTSVETEQEMLEFMGEFSDLASDLMKAIN